MIPSLILTSILGIALFLASRSGYDSWIPAQWPYMLLFFLAVSYLIHRLMAFGFRNKREKFVEFYLSTVVMRLVLCIVFVGVNLYLGVENAPVFVAHFFGMYFLYTIFEIRGLYRTLRRDSQ